MGTFGKVIIGLILVVAIIAIPLAGAYVGYLHGKSIGDLEVQDMQIQVKQQTAAATIAAKQQQAADDAAQLKRTQDALQHEIWVANGAAKASQTFEDEINALKKIPADDAWLAAPVPPGIGCLLNNTTACSAASHNPAH